MRQEGRILATLLAAGALSIGFTGTASAILADDQYSLTQPAAELVMPFDARDGKATFLIVSNPTAVSPGASQISTHWIFWGSNCKELANVSMCLTLDDSVVVDPRSIQGLGPNNEPLGPIVNLSGNAGVVTVVAYETDEACNPYTRTGEILKDEAIVGTFTLADIGAGYSFGNDALGLFLNDAGDAVQVPDGRDVNRYALQTLNPEDLEATLVVLAQLTEADSIVTPAGSQKYFASFYDNVETATSLPDVQVGCPAYRTVTGGTAPLIPDFVTVASSGIISLDPSPNIGQNQYLFGIIGQAVGTFGASARVKEDVNREIPL